LEKKKEPTSENHNNKTISEAVCRSVMKDVNAALKLNPKLKLGYCIAATCFNDSHQYKKAVGYLDKLLGKKKSSILHTENHNNKLRGWQAHALASRADILFKIYSNTPGSLKPTLNRESAEFLQTIAKELPVNIRNYKSLVKKSPLYRAIEDCRVIRDSLHSEIYRGIASPIFSCVLQDQKKKRGKNAKNTPKGVLPFRVDGKMMYIEF